MVSATERESTASPIIVANSKFYYDQTGQRFLKTHTRNGVTIKTWYLGDGIEFREKYVGVTSNSTGTFDAYQATKYIYGADDKKLASITGSVQNSHPTATTSNMFALADSYSSSSITGLASKTFYTFYGIYAHENFVKFLRIGSFALAAILLILYLIYGQRRESTFPVWMRLTAATMLLSFLTVNCGTGNTPGSTPSDLGGLGTPGTSTTGAAPSNTFISALYTGLPVGTVYYSHNYLGSGALVTDSAGNEIFRITYTEYGEIDLANSGKFNPDTGEIEHHLDAALIAVTAVKYTGQQYDPETGFYYYNARYYDPQLGVFTSADTVYDNNAGSFGFNRHMYVAGNPVMHSDPSGHNFWKVLGVVAVIAAAVAATVLTAGAMAPATAAATTAGVGGSVATGTAVGVGTAAAGSSIGFGTAVGIGAVSGAAGGFVGGAGMAMVNGETNFGNILSAGLMGAYGGAVGGALGAGFGFAGNAVGKLGGFWGAAGKETLMAAGVFGRSFASTMVSGCLSTPDACNGDMMKNAAIGGAISLGAYQLGRLSAYRSLIKSDKQQFDPRTGEPNGKGLLRLAYARDRASFYGDGDPSVNQDYLDDAQKAANVTTPTSKTFGWKMLSYIPTLDAISNVHDDWLERMGYKVASATPFSVNAGTAALSFAYTQWDIALTTAEFYPWDRR